MFNAIKRISKMGKLAIVIILQLSISLSLINSSSILVFNNNKKKNGLESLFNTTVSHLIRIIPLGGFDNMPADFDYFKSFEVANDNYSMFYELKKEKLIKKDFIYYCSIMPIDAIDENIPKKYKNLVEFKQREYMSKIVVNDNFIENYNIEIIEGRKLNIEDTKKDYKKDNIPILIGKDLKEFFKIGDKIKDKNWATIDEVDEITFEVVGIMDELAIPATTGYEGSFASSVIFGNSFTVIPTVSNFLSLSHGAAIGDCGVILELGPGVSLSEVNSKLNSKLNPLGFEVESYSLKMLNIASLNFARDYKSALALGIVLVILAMLGTTSILLGIINKRKNEFAISLSYGAHINDIIKEFICEILMLIIISTLISIVISIGNIPSLSVILMNIGIIVLLTIIIAILPIRRLKKLNLIDLLKK